MMNPDTLAGVLENAWQRWPERPALVYGDRKMTYGEMGRAVMTLADAYRRLGISRGERVLCSASNRPEKVMALAAAWACGAVHVGVDYQFTPSELSAVIELTQAGTLIYEVVDGGSDAFVGLEALQKDHPTLRIIIVSDRPIPKDYLTLWQLIEAGAVTEGLSDGPFPEDPALIFISSGTTGKPKATVGYHRNLCQRWSRLAGWFAFGPDDVHLVQMPLSHGFGLMMAVAGLCAGGKLVLLSQFSAEETLQVVTTEHVTILNGTPAYFKLIMRCLDPARHNVQSLRLSVGTAASFSPSLVRSLWHDLGVKFVFMYGSSEGVGVATTDREDILRGSVGRPEPGSVAIVGPDHSPLPRGEVGEIVFSRRVYPVRYWHEAGSASLTAVTRDATESGNSWYYSGDLGRLDDEGRLYVFGRLKHQIDRGGLKIDPVEVEAALLESPSVSDGAVIGLPNPILGETVCACVVPMSEQVPSLEELRTVLSGTLAPYKLPEELCILAAIPRTRLGKVDLERLRVEVMKTARQSLHQR
jgi:acyl-CoA synthetase (AMP-forming)/AMP-acid ligase II